MTKYQIRYSEEFAYSLENIFHDLEQNSILAANKLRDDIKSKLKLLIRNPYAWSKIISPIKYLEKYRRIILIYDNLIFYVIDNKNKTIYIVDVMNAKQDYWHLLS